MRLTVFLLSLVLLCAAPGVARAANWTPPGPVTLLIGSEYGSSADTQARLIAEGLRARYGWDVRPVQLGDTMGGVRLATTLRRAPQNGTVIGLMETDALSYTMMAVDGAEYRLDEFTPLTTTSQIQTAITAAPARGLRTWQDVVAMGRRGMRPRFGVTSPRLAEIAFLLGQRHGIQFDLQLVPGDATVMGGLLNGTLDLGWTSGGEAPYLRSGQLVTLASGLSRRLSAAPHAPTVLELGAEYAADGYFMLAAPAGLSPVARNALSRAIATVAHDPRTRAGQFIRATFGGAAIVHGQQLNGYLASLGHQALGLMEAASDMEEEDALFLTRR